MKVLEVGSAAWKKLGNSLVQKELDNMIAIGTVGYVPGLCIVSNRLRKRAEDLDDSLGLLLLLSVSRRPVLYLEVSPGLRIPKAFSNGDR